jgi:hypothetical protein
MIKILKDLKVELNKEIGTNYSILHDLLDQEKLSLGSRKTKAY